MTAEPPGSAQANLIHGDGADSVARRAPFADNPFVGERGQKAQQRIIEAALEVFKEHGYHGCGVQRITELSGCSRASFYQYFSSKEDLFRHLAGRVARHLADSLAELGPITGDRAGWQVLRDWLDRYSAIYDAFEPVFITFQTAAANDIAVSTGAARVATRTFTGIRSKVDGSPLPSAQIDAVVRTLLDSVAAANRMSETLSPPPAEGPDAMRQQMNDAVADVFHRSLFGIDAEVNALPAPRRTLAAVPARPDPALPSSDADTDTMGTAARKTRTRLLEAGHRVFAEHGFNATRVDDIVAAADVSHGVFYRYFKNKTDLFEILVRRANERLASAIVELPGITSGAEDTDVPAELRRWLKRYTRTYAQEASIISMWSDLTSPNPSLQSVSAAAIESGRITVERFLGPRSFGNPEAESLVFLVIVTALAAQRTTPSRINAVAQLVERGFLATP